GGCRSTASTGTADRVEPASAIARAANQGRANGVARRIYRRTPQPSPVHDVLAQHLGPAVLLLARVVRIAVGDARSLLEEGIMQLGRVVGRAQLEEQVGDEPSNLLDLGDLSHHPEP